jgi:hypothetical protein
MTQIILLLAFPIGLYIYFWDKRNIIEADAIFDTFIITTKQNSTLTTEDKINRIAEMFKQNEFKTVTKNENLLIVQKKHLNIGTAIMIFGLFNYFGILIFLFYYFFILKPIEKIISF